MNTIANATIASNVRMPDIDLNDVQSSGLKNGADSARGSSSVAQLAKMKQRESVIIKLANSIIHLDEKERKMLEPDFQVVERQLKSIMIDKQKRWGIEPEKYSNKTLAVSYSLDVEEKEADKTEELPQKSIYDCMIINQDGCYNCTMGVFF